MEMNERVETKFKFVKDAKNYVKELNEKGIAAKVYRGHRAFVVQHYPDTVNDYVIKGTKSERA